MESCRNRNMFKIRDVQVMELQPVPTYYDLILERTEPLSLAAIAEDYDKMENELFHYLLSKEILLSRPGLVYPNPEYACKGYTSTLWIEEQQGKEWNLHSGSADDFERAVSLGKVQILWTQKGQLFLYELFKSEGWLPKIEWRKAN